jgi:hypothetical protein
MKNLVEGFSGNSPENLVKKINEWRSAPSNAQYVLGQLHYQAVQRHGGSVDYTALQEYETR